MYFFVSLNLVACLVAAKYARGVAEGRGAWLAFHWRNGMWG